MNVSVRYGYNGSAAYLQASVTSWAAFNVPGAGMTSLVCEAGSANLNNPSMFFYNIDYAEDDVTCTFSAEMEGITYSGSFVAGGSRTDAGNGTFDLVTRLQDLTVTVTAPPSATLSGLADPIGAAGDSVTLTFGAAIPGLTLGDLSFVGSNVDLSNLSTSDGGTTYTFLATPIADGLVSLTLEADGAAVTPAVTRAVADPRWRASNTVTSTADVTAPVVTLSGVAAGAPGQYIATLDVTGVTGYAAGGLTTSAVPVFTNASAFPGGTSFGDFTPSADDGTITASFRPDYNNASVGVTVPAGLLRDAAGNTNAETVIPLGSFAGGTLNTVIYAPDAVNSTRGFTVGVNFSAPLDPATVGTGDLVVTNGSVTSFWETGGGANTDFAFIVEPDGTGDIGISFPADGVASTSNVPNAAAQPVTVTYDADGPVPTISYVGFSHVDPFTATIAFDEPVFGFEEGDVTLEGVSISSFTETTPGELWTLVVQPNAPGVVPGISVAPGVARDAVSNDNVASVLDGSVPSPDGTFPTLTITGVPQDFAGPVSETITFTFSESVAGFDAGDVEVTGGSLTSALSGSGETYTATLSVDGNADVVVTVPAGAAIDGSGDPNVLATVTGLAALGPPAEELIATFLEARGQALLGNQPGLRGFLGGGGPATGTAVPRRARRSSRAASET